MAEVVCKICGKVCKNLRGWKTHMSATHGGYDDVQLTEIAGVSTGGDVKARMENFAATMPESGVNIASSSAKSSETGAPEPAPTLPKEKRIRATPKKVKKILGAIPAKILESTGTELDFEDREAIDEASEFLTDVFGIEFAIPESKYVVESRFFALLWVAAITFLVWTKHHVPEFAKMLKDTDKKDTKESDKVAEKK